MFSCVFVCSWERGYDVSFCLAAWPHVHSGDLPTGGDLPTEGGSASRCGLSLEGLPTGRMVTF